MISLLLKYNVEKVIIYMNVWEESHYVYKPMMQWKGTIQYEPFSVIHHIEFFQTLLFQLVPRKAQVNNNNASVHFWTLTQSLECPRGTTFKPIAI